MKRIHMPRLNPRYWTSIILASIFGTNLGDLYAETGNFWAEGSSAGIVTGLLVLAFLAAIVFGVERKDRRAHEAYYWLVIMIIRTGATNIGDYTAFVMNVPPPALSLSLAGLLAAFGWRSVHAATLGDAASAEHRLPDTGPAYWLAMLAAGVFGTVVGDICQGAVGQVPASIGLTALFGVLLLARHRVPTHRLALYWIAIAAARTAGTAIGDLLAENDSLGLGLPTATVLTGTVFVGVLVLWRAPPVGTEPARGVRT